MTEITLKLTFEELQQIDKFVELNDETRPLFDKIQNAYPEPETLFDVIRNLGYCVDDVYEIVDAVEEFEKSKEPEDNEWKTVALGFGENLSAIGPCGYYDFTPVEWYDWVVDIYENTANEYLKLLEKERAKAKAQKHEKWDVVRESVKWCEEHQNESVEDYLKPKTAKEPEDWDIKVETDYLTGKARHKTKIVDKDGNDYKPTPQEEPKELKTLYQMLNDDECRDDVCKVVKEWMSQYEFNGWEDDWDVGFSDCFYKLNKGLK